MDEVDAILVEQCLNGNKESFAELMRRYQDQVFNLAYRMTNSRADAEDLTQETFIRAYRKLRTYNSKYCFRNWIMTVCANLTRNMFGKRMRIMRAEQTHTELRYLHDNKSSVDREALERAMNKLSPVLRVPVVLKYAEDYSYEDIAQILGIGVSAAKMRVKRGRSQLAELLRHDGNQGYDSGRRRPEKRR